MLRKIVLVRSVVLKYWSFTDNELKVVAQLCLVLECEVLLMAVEVRNYVCTVGMCCWYWNVS